MRPKPYARGRCHIANYVGETEFPTILVPDIHGSHSIPMSRPATCGVGAMKDASLGFAFAPMPTHRAGFAGMVFFLQHHLHSQSHGFIGELVSDGTKGPLMQFLIGGRATIQFVPNIAHIADGQELHALLIQRGNQSGRLLVFDILDLVFDLVELPLLRGKQLFATS